ncbi:MAG TPA: hypothetical protein VG013_24650 [Gemmataceae bacterium]|nr:hypothetical protein [Gemmataceae bacterium]
MTEAEWFACTDPQIMLQFLLRNKASDRKLRLFAVACCRRVWDWLGDRSRHAVEVVERYVDGLASGEELHIAAKRAADEWVSEFGTHHPSNAAYCLTLFGNTTAHDAAVGVTAEVVEAVRCEACTTTGISLQGWPSKADPVVTKVCIEAGEAATVTERETQSRLLRDMFHGPRRPVLVRSSWKTAAVVELARQFYVEKTFHRLPALAEALVSSGCDNADFLDSFQQRGQHVRGCWFLDVLLGKG